MATPREKANIVRKALSKGYNMDLDEFMSFYGSDFGKAYVTAKWRLMSSNFTRWFCELDQSMADKFMEDL